MKQAMRLRILRVEDALGVDRDDWPEALMQDDEDPALFHDWHGRRYWLGDDDVLRNEHGEPVSTDALRAVIYTGHGRRIPAALPWREP